MAMLFCLVLLRDLMETRKRDTASQAEPERWARLLNLGIGFYLLVICDSATALSCFLLGVTLLLGGKHLARMRSASTVITTGVLSLACAALLNQILGLSDSLLEALGRDASLTGRSDIK
jgi:hypothetical protein